MPDIVKAHDDLSKADTCPYYRSKPYAIFEYEPGPYTIPCSQCAEVLQSTLVLIVKPVNGVLPKSMFEIDILEQLEDFYDKRGKAAR